MQSLTTLAILAAVVLTVGVSGQDRLLTSARYTIRAITTAPPALPGNAATTTKVELGTMLSFDPRLSAGHGISCSSCHNIGLGGVDAQETSIGHRWQRGGRNAPTVFNAVFNTVQFWDGRAKNLKEQAGGPLVNPVEMASPPEHVIEQLAAIPGYVAKFKTAFPGESQPLSLANAQKAIAVFEASLITPNAPFDKFLPGDASALTATEKQGLQLFMEKGCAACHYGINVGGARVLALRRRREARRRVPAAGRQRPFHGHQERERQVCVRGPTLRNIALTAPYFTPDGRASCARRPR